MIEEQVWVSNLKGTKAHLAGYGWTGQGTGIVALCDKKGIYLRDDRPVPEEKCKSCSKRPVGPR